MAIIIGTPGNDFLSSTMRGDILLGMAGDDTLVALHEFNILLGGYGDDQLTALSSFNILSGGAGNDFLQADRGRNLLSGGDGDDTLISSADRNTLSGDAGNDYLTVVAGSGNVLNGGAGDDRLSAFSGGNTLNGDAGDDALYVDFGGGNVLNGGDGNDLFEAYSGNNLLNGGAGNDTFYSVGSANLVNGGDGDDVLAAYSSGNVLNGDTGNDFLIVAGGSGNTLSGGEGDDSIQISASGNTAEGNGGNDQLFVFDGAGNVLSGGDGMDLLSTQSHSNTLNGDAGNDSLVVSGSGNILNGGDDDDFFNSGFDVNNNILNGNAGNDFLQIWSGIGNVLNGGVGNDLLVSFGSNVLNGGAGNDTVLANDGSNILNGDEGDDTLAAAGSSVGNLLDGGDGDDQVQAFTDSNILNGGGGNDLLNVFGGAGNFVNGGDGLDLLTAFANNNILNGDAGNDVVAVNGGNGNILSGGEGDDNLGAVSSIGSILNGDGGNDQLDVDGGSGNLFNGGDGDDLFRLFVSASNVFNGNTGNDSFVSIAFAGSTGNTVSGGEGDDSVQLSGSGNFVNGDAGDDNLTVDGGTGNLLDGGDGNDTLSSGEGDDTLLGQAGNDTIRGGAGADILMGGEGIDTLTYEDSPSRVIVNMFNMSTITIGGISVGPGQAFDGFGTFDTISGFEAVIGSPFNDWIQGSTNVANLLMGGAGNDTLAGSGMSDNIPDAADDTLLGGPGNDVLRQTRGHDFLDGGPGFNDRLEFVNTGIAYGGAIGVNVNLGTGISDADPSGSDLQNGPGGNTATILGIEQVFGTAGDDVLTGGSLARTGGGAFTEVFRGGAGNDVIDGQGADTLQGAFDNDRVEYIDAPGPVWVNLATGMAFDGYGTIDTLHHVNHVMGSDFADTLIGGNPEYDHTFERFEGRGGNDFMDGGSGFDEVSYQNASGPVTVNLGTGTGGGVSTDTFINMEGVRGSQFGDTLTGSDNLNVVEHFIGDGGNDTIDGGAGVDFASWQAVALTAGGVNAFIENGSGVVFHSAVGTDTLTNIEGLAGTNSGDTLAGGMGDQWFRGRGGSDTLDGGAGSDTADYSVDPGAVTVNLAANTATDGWGGIWEMQGFDTLWNIENVLGSQFSDSLTGDADANRLDGGAGNDTIEGGAGNDSFVYSATPASGNADLVTDFVGGADSVHLDASRLTGLTQNGLLDPSLFVSGNFTSAQDTTQRIVYNTTTGELYYDADGLGSVASVKILTLQQSGSPATVSASDFVVFNATGGGVGNVYLWSALSDGQSIVFDPDQDQLFFDDPAISAAFLAVDANAEAIPPLTIFSFGGKTVTLFTSPYTITTANVTFADGSLLIVGDNTTAVPTIPDTADGAVNTITGGSGNDLLIGLGGADSISGGDGDDLFPMVVDEATSGMYGSDAINGGNGSDTLVYYGPLFAVNVDLGVGTATGGDGSPGSTLTLTGIENVEGTEFNDTLTGDANANTIQGLAGTDTLVGGEGIDTLSYEDSPSRVIVNMFNTSSITVGGITVDPGHAFDGFTPPPVPFPAPTDTISGFENVIGSAFNDYIQGTTNVANRLEGGAGNDTLAGSGMNDNLPGGAMDDTLLGGAGNDVLRQSRGNDVIDGGEDFDQLEFTNNGIVYGGAIGVNVNLAAGTSDADPNNGDPVNDPLVNGRDDVATVSGIESVVGTLGNDVFTGGDPLHAPVFESGQTEFFRTLGGNDTINGAPGRGWSAGVDYLTNSSLQPVMVVLGNSNNIGFASDGLGGTDTLIDVDLVRGGAGDDVLVGGSYSQGASGIFVEAFRGNAGNDTIDGGGSDTVIGSYGVTDRAEYNSSPGPVTVNLATGTAFDGFGGTDTLIDINVVRGSNFNDTLVGGNPAFDNNERFDGLAGDDFIDGGSGNDEADYSSSTAAVLVDLGTGNASDGFGGTDTLVSVEWARGSDFNDTLIGGANVLERFTGGRGNDSIDGGSMTGVNYASFLLGTSGANAFVENGTGMAINDGQGGTDTLVNINGLWGTNFNDTLTGGTGDQWFVGQGGNDTIDGGADTDTVSYRADPNGVTVDLSTGTATDGWGGIWGLQGTDSLSNIENVEGSSFNDNITGDANANIIYGGGGVDAVTGGGGADVFGFRISAVNNTVTDFSDDVLDFSPLFTAAGVAVPPGEDPLEWLLNQGYLVADSTANVVGGAANDTVVQVDLDGSAGAEAAYTVVTLMDVTLGTSGFDADNWLV